MEFTELTSDDIDVVNMLLKSAERRLAKAQNTLLSNPDSNTITRCAEDIAGREVEVRVYQRFAGGDQRAAHAELAQSLFDNRPRSTDQFANAVTLAKADAAKRILRELRGIVDADALLD